MWPFGGRYSQSKRKNAFATKLIEQPIISCDSYYANPKHQSRNTEEQETHLVVGTAHSCGIRCILQGGGTSDSEKIKKIIKQSHDKTTYIISDDNFFASLRLTSNLVKSWNETNSAVEMCTLELEFIMTGEDAMDFAIWIGWCLIQKIKQEILFSMSIGSSCTCIWLNCVKETSHVPNARFTAFSRGLKNINLHSDWN